MRRIGQKILAAILVVSCLASVAGCGKKTEESPPAQMVKTIKAGGSIDSDNAVYAGEVRGRYETNLSFQVGGKILSRNVQLGSRVQAGDTLMRIDSRDAVETANKGTAQVAAAQAQLTLAEANLNRYAQLYAQEAVSSATLDQYQSAYDSAKASYEQARAQSVQGYNQLGYTDLIADSAGVISNVQGEAGQVVAAGQTVLTLVRTDELEVEFSVPENKIAMVAQGTKVDVSFWALSGIQVNGVVREVSPMADAVTRTYKVRVSLPQPPAGMQLGMTASVSCNSSAMTGNSSSGDIVLPLSAIYQTGADPQVWIVNDSNQVELRTVAVEAFGDNQVRVKGLVPGTIVVTAGVHKLREGQTVRLEEGVSK